MAHPDHEDADDPFGLSDATRTFVSALADGDKHGHNGAGLAGWLVALVAAQTDMMARPPPDPRIDAILAALQSIQAKETIMSAEMDALVAQVHANSDLLDAATVMINGIADRIAAAGVDPAALQALTDELRAKDATLADAVAANTPVVPAPDPAPTP